ncbi:MAG: cysteine hydrolase [Candidatus Omnitrophica bacterium]|nr:cysteine hydrolase [Candidatus Omnitrophota bacterium]
MRVLLVIDMLKDFMDEDGALYCGKESRRIVSFIKEKIRECRTSDCRVIYVCDAHDPRDKEFRMFKPHAVKGSEGAKVIDELRPETADIIVEKTTYDAFYDTELDRVLKETGAGRVEVVGVCTSICVMEAVGVLSLKGYDVVVHKDGVADFDQEAHCFALNRMEKVYGAKVEG